MQHRKSHIPLIPRTANYSCSLANRSPRKKNVSVQTDKCISPFQNSFESNRNSKDELTVNEETTKTYTKALECVNSFHSCMNKKLKEKFGDCGDTKLEGNRIFKLPDVPNYATVFLMLLEKTKKPKLLGNNGNKPKKKTEFEPKKYTTKESVIEFVPEIKEMAEYKAFEQNESIKEIPMAEQEVQTNISHLKDDESASCPSKNFNEDISSVLKKSSKLHSVLDDPNLEKKKKGLAENILKKNQETDKGEITPVTEKDKIESPVDCPTETTDSKTPYDKSLMMDIIKKRVQEEISSFLDKNNAGQKKKTPRQLIKSHFHVVNIPPQINLLEYAQKKLERQLTADQRPVSGSEITRKQFFSNCISVRKSMNITPTTTKKVTNMFRKFSQENIGSVEEGFEKKASNGDCSESDEDSVIFDDEEFQKMNGCMDEEIDLKQNKNNPALGEKSNPLKLTMRDMTRVNEKMLSTIGLFTERGDVRPGVIDILEEQKKAKAKDSRNKQFRSRRQWDLQIHLNPKENISSSFTTVSTEKSFISLSSSDLRSDYVTVKNVSQQLDYNN